MSLDEVKNKIVGLALDEAKKLAATLGFKQTRIASQDGKAMRLSMDYVEDRLNLHVENGIVRDVRTG